jgi:hypothetical protein
MRGVLASLSVKFCSLTAPEGADRLRHHLRKLRCLAFLGPHLVHGHIGLSYAPPCLSCRALAALRRIRLGARSARSTPTNMYSRCRQERVCPAPSRPRARRSPSPRNLPKCPRNCACGAPRLPPVTAILAVQRQRRGRGLGRDQRVAHEDPGVALDDAYVEQAYPQTWWIPLVTSNRSFPVIRVG